MNQQTVIIFDVFKTLIDIETDEENPFAYQFLSSWLSYAGLQISAGEFQASFRRHDRLAIQKNPNQYPDIDVGDVFRNLFFEAGPPAFIDLDKLVQDTALLFRLLTTISLTIYPETHRVLQELAQHPGIRLCIASNTQRLFTIPELRKFDLEKYFEQIIFSSDVKACKPNPKIFLAALAAMQAAPAEAIYIGDNLFDDVGGAQQVGLRTIWIQRGGNYTYPADFIKPAPDAQIAGTDFGELPDKIYNLINIG